MSNGLLVGSKIMGGNPKNERIENDFYATNPKAVEMLLDNHEFLGEHILEPCVGQGHIAKTLNKHFPNLDSITCLDIVDRGYPNTIITDFLAWNTNETFDTIITNPPYSLSSEFIEKGMSLLSESGQMALFLKIQFLEGVKRKELFDKYPPKYVYVFRSRMATWSDGREINPDTGKKWITTFCNAWYVWEKGSQTEPVIRWL